MCSLTNRTFNCLFRCPLLLDMDMVSFAKHFIHLELPSCALSCLLLIPQSNVKEKHIKGLLSSNCHIDILDQLADLRNKGKSVPLADQVILSGDTMVVKYNQYTSFYHYFVACRDNYCLLLSNVLKVFPNGRIARVCRGTHKHQFCETLMVSVHCVTLTSQFFCRFLGQYSYILTSKGCTV